MKTCIHCGAEKPPEAFSPTRATCRECAKQRWYSPTQEVPVHRGKNWVWLSRLARTRPDLIKYPDHVDIWKGVR